MAFLIIAPPPPPLLPSFHCAVTSRLRLLYITSVSSCVSTVCLPVCEDQQAVTLQPTQPGNTRKQEIDLFLRCCTWCGFFRGNRRRKKKGGREARAGGRSLDAHRKSYFIALLIWVIRICEDEMRRDLGADPGDRWGSGNTPNMR